MTYLHCFFPDLKLMYDVFSLHCHGQGVAILEFLETNALKQQQKWID